MAIFETSNGLPVLSSHFTLTKHISLQEEVLLEIEEALIFSSNPPLREAHSNFCLENFCVVAIS